MAENKAIYIIDASVVLKWFLQEGEPFKKEASVLRDDFSKKHIRLIIPDYSFAEILNTLIRKLESKQALACFSALLALDITRYEMSLELALFTFKIMEEFPGISFYDAGYHGLALLENGTFITADKQYFSKTQKKGNIMFLKNYVLG